MNSKFNKNDFQPLFSFTSGKAKLYEKRSVEIGIWDELGVGVVILSTKVCNGQRNYSVFFELSNEKLPIGAVSLSPHNEMMNMPMIVPQDEECRTWNIIHVINDMQSVSRSFTFFNSQHGEKFQEMLKRFLNKMHEFRSSLNNTMTMNNNNNNNGLMPNQMMSPNPCHNMGNNNMNMMNGNYFMDNNKKYLPRRNQKKSNGQQHHHFHQNNMNMNHNNNFEDMTMPMTMPATSSPFFTESPLLPPLNKNPLPFQSPYFQCENNINNNNNKMFKMKGQNKNGNKNNNNNGSMWKSSTNDLREPFSSSNGQDFFGGGNGNGNFFSHPNSENNNNNEKNIFSTTIKNDSVDYVPFFDQQQLQYQQQQHPSMFVGIEEEQQQHLGNRNRPLSTHSSYSSSSASASSYPFFQDMDSLKSPGAPIMNINNAMNNDGDDINTPLSSGIFNFNMDFLCGSDGEPDKFINTYSPFTSPMISNIENINGTNKDKDDMDLTIQGVSPDPFTSGDDDEAKSPNLQSRFFPHIKINGENTTTTNTGTINTSTTATNNNNNSYGGKKFTLSSMSSDDEVVVDNHKKPLRSTYNSNGYGHKDFGHFRSNNHNNNNKNKSSNTFDSSSSTNNNFDPFSTTTSAAPMSTFPSTTTTSTINNQQDNYHDNYFGSSTTMSTSNSNFTPPMEYKPKEEEKGIPFKAEFVNGADWDSDLDDKNLLFDSVCDMYVKVLAETDGETTNVKLGNDTSEHLGEGNLQIYLIRDRRLAWVVFRQGEGSSGILFQTPIFEDLILTSYKAVLEKKQITWNGIVLEVKTPEKEKEEKEKEGTTGGDGQEMLKSKKNITLKRFAAIFPKTRIYTSATLAFIESFCASKAKISLAKFVALTEMTHGLSAVQQLLKINSENSN